VAIGIAETLRTILLKNIFGIPAEQINPDLGTYTCKNTRHIKSERAVGYQAAMKLIPDSSA